jgi:hypothetical protein
MAKILYPQVITEDLDDLKELEKYHRYSHLFQRVRMLGLLKSEECSNLAEAARALGYGLLLASVPEVVRLLSEGRHRGASEEQST